MKNTKPNITPLEKTSWNIRKKVVWNFSVVKPFPATLSFYSLSIHQPTFIMFNIRISYIDPISENKSNSNRGRSFYLVDKTHQEKSEDQVNSLRQNRIRDLKVRRE